MAALVNDGPIPPAIDFARPFPRLSDSERLHLELHGYVVIETLLAPADVATLRDKLYALEDDYHAHGPVRVQGQSGLPGWNNGGTPTADWDTGRRTHFYSGRTRHFFRIDNLLHVDDCFLRYVLHPRIVGMAEEAIGGPARYEQSDAHIIRPPADFDQQQHNFHRGGSSHMAYTANGLYHYPFVKALTNLSDLGPDDGGTVVIAGSHKVPDGLVPDVVEVASSAAGRSLVHKVVAPAGSTLCFFESLLHSSGINRSGDDRPIMISGYCATWGQAWDGYDPDPVLRDRLPAAAWQFLDGSQRWMWRPSPRPRLTEG